MNRAIRKMYFSILTALLVLVTTITTTYAWFGIDFGHSIEDFEINFDSSSAEGLELSLDGINYSSYITTEDVEKAILREKGISYNELTYKRKFKEVASLRASSTGLNSENLNFVDMFNFSSNEYLNFTFYVRPSYIVGLEDNPTEGVFTRDHTIDVFFKDNDMIESEYVDTHLINVINHPTFGPISRASVNPKNATRFALTKYEAIDKNQEYDDNSEYKTTIYNPGGDKITYNEVNNRYNFGGIVEDDKNVALQDFNMKFNKKLSVPYFASNRKDVNLDYNQIIDSRTDGLSIDRVMKFKFYFWYEGWDADCFEAVKNSKVSICLNLTTQNPKLIS